MKFYRVLPNLLRLLLKLAIFLRPPLHQFPSDTQALELILHATLQELSQLYHPLPCMFLGTLRWFAHLW